MENAAFQISYQLFVPKNSLMDDKNCDKTEE